MTDYEKFMVQAHQLSFMQYFWRKRNDPMKVGLHTRAICERIDKAINDLDEGKSTCLIITVPFRHGKSDIISRYASAHFIGTHPDSDVMIVTYASSLATGFSKFARDIVDSPEYYEVYGKKLSKTKGASDEWGLEGYTGTVTASGLTSGITGKGYVFGILDDYCAGREEAESVVMREKAWDSFTNDFFTRQAPISITIILATPWHTDDIIGRIKAFNDPTSDKYDPEFTKFEVLSFPAMNGTAEVVNNKGEKEIVNYDYLFTEKTLSTGEKIDGRFTPEWYKKQMATLGSYGTASLLQCNPTVRGGNMLNLSNIHVHNSISEFPVIQYFRIWDLAHSAKQRIKSDPDWTSGTLLGFRKINGVDELWIKNVSRIRAEAPERDKFIGAVSDKDGQGVPIGIEISLDARDSVRVLQNATKGRRIIKPIKTVGDKVARMSYLEPIFEAGNVHILRDEWNLDWLNELREFPSGKHDDQVDNLSAGYALTHNQKHEIQIVRVNGVI